MVIMDLNFLFNFIKRVYINKCLKFENMYYMYIVKKM